MKNAGDIAATAHRLQAEGIEFFLVSNGLMKPALDLCPLGVDVRWIDALGNADNTWSVMEFLKLYNLIDGLAFGPRGLPMPHWVMVDLALLPSAIVIAAWPKERLLAETQSERYSDEVRARLDEILSDVESLDYSGPIPVAAYCAAPTLQPGRCVGWSLWSFVTGRNLATVVKGLALSAYQATILDGVTQYDNVSLRVHTKFGPLRLRSASLGIHTSPNSFVYETDLTSASPMAQDPTFWLDAHDTARQRLMQKSIESKTSDFYIVAPGVTFAAGNPVVPILEIPLNA